MNYKDNLEPKPVIPGAIYIKFKDLENKIECYDKNKIHIGTIESKTFELCKPSITGQSIRKEKNNENFILEKYFCCNDMQRKIEKKFIWIDKIFRHYHIGKYYEKNTSHIIKFCPWCGKKLMKSLSDKWWEEISKIFKVSIYSLELIDIAEKKVYPKEFDSDEWWIKRESWFWI